MYCNNCGNQLEENSKFCNSCGAKIGTILETVENPTIYSAEFNCDPRLRVINGKSISLDEVVNKFGKAKIAAIKYIRDNTGIGLKEAKSIIDEAYAGYSGNEMKNVEKQSKGDNGSINTDEKKNKKPRNPRTPKILFFAIACLMMISTLVASASTDFPMSAKDALVEKASNFIFSFFLFFLPSFFMMFDKIRNKIPLFNKRKIGFTLLGWFVLAFISGIIMFGIDGMHSVEYKVAKENFAAQAELKDEQNSAALVAAETTLLDETLESTSEETTSSTAEATTNTTTIQATTNENTSKLQSPICQDLMARGINENIAIEAFDIVKEVNLPIWENKDSILVENSELSSSNDYIFSYAAKDGGFDTVYAFHVLDGKIVEIVDEDQNLIYNKNGLNENYVFYSEFEDIDTLISYSKMIVESVLKSPSSAEFPGSWLDPYEGWAAGKNEDTLTIQSYVDSQNSFGAMIRTNFTLKFQVVDGETQAQYFKFGDDVLSNNLK